MRAPAAALLLAACLSGAAAPPARARLRRPAPPRLAPARRPLPPPTAAQLRAGGLDHFYNLEYARAAADFSRLASLEPNNASAWNHLAQSVLYGEMYRVGALQSELYGHGDPFLETKLPPADPAVLATFMGDDQRAMEVAAAAIAAHPGQAEPHYDLAVAWALRGTMAFSLQSSYLAALGDAKSARREAARALALDPRMVDPLLILGVHNYVAGSLPWTAKIFSVVMGYSGNQALGWQQIETVAEQGENSRADADVMLAVMDRREGKNSAAAPILDQLALAYPRNVLFAVEAAEAHEAAGEHPQALARYEAIVARARPPAQPGYERAPLDKVWYDLGNIERMGSAWRQADDDYAQVESWSRSRPRYVQAAALAAGEVELKMGNRAAARAQFSRCVAISSTTAAGLAAAEALRH